MLTWLGKSERPVATIASGRVFLTSVGRISGSGFSWQNDGIFTMGLIISEVTARPRKSYENVGLSGPTKDCEPPCPQQSSLYLFIPIFAALVNHPELSHIIIFSRRTPMETKILRRSRAAPAPFITTLMSSSFLLVMMQALIRAAPEIMACSVLMSWKTGIFISFSRSSISKHPP